MNIGDHSAVISHSNSGGQKALGNTEGHIDTCWFSPFCDDIAVLYYDSGLRTTCFMRTDAIAKGLPPKRLIVCYL